MIEVLMAIPTQVENRGNKDHLLHAPYQSSASFGDPGIYTGIKTNTTLKSCSDFANG
jgi:hypothetical protein